MVSFNTEQPAFKDLRSIIKERTNSIVAWVGAGLSSEANLPTWAKLKDNLISDLTSIYNALPDLDRRKKLIRTIDNIRKQPDFWRSFSNLKDAMGQTEFVASIRRSLGNSIQCKIPSSYERLWEMQVSGILTLNIDGFAKRSFSSVNGSKVLIDFNGNDIQERVLKNNTEFVGHLHGDYDNDSSWVFTKGELDKLLQNPKYKTFISALLCSRTVLFLGISMDDQAVSKHFESLNNIDFDAGDHFWLTERSDSKTAKFADRLGIRLIYFDAPGGDYSAVNGFFDSIAEFVPAEIEAPPPFCLQEKENEIGLPSLKDLCKMNADDIRWHMNVEAADILSPADEESYIKYDEFCSEYNEAIYRAWYVGIDENANSLLGYHLLEEVQHPGAFGRVFKAKSPSGEIVAVKVLHESIRRDSERLQSFRRGTRAMKILTTHRMRGMVQFREACEIPAMVVMDWIDGPNLNQAVQSRYIDSWQDVLHIGSDLAQIIRSAHKLPERILHRDVRPPNVMMEKGFGEDSGWDLKVLDFDLSWHKDSFEKSISSASSPTGYLAPEQLTRKIGISTRNAAVDSFGVGMTLFFLVSRRDPIPNEHLNPGWTETVKSYCIGFGRSEWACIPFRIARLIVKATKDHQHERCDMAFIERELLRLYSLECGKIDYITTVVLMEEIAARANYQYKWDSDHDRAILSTVRGLEAEMKNDEISGVVTGSIRWSQEHPQEYQSVKKYLPRQSASACSILKRGGWKAKKSSRGNYGVIIDFHAKLEYSSDQISKLSESMSSAINEVSMVSRY